MLSLTIIENEFQYHGLSFRGKNAVFSAHFGPGGAVPPPRVSPFSKVKGSSRQKRNGFPLCENKKRPRSRERDRPFKCGLVREAGLEPAWPGRWILSPVRLPIPPLSQTVAQISKRAGAAQAIAPAPLLRTTAGKENSFPASSCEFI